MELRLELGTNTGKIMKINAFFSDFVIGDIQMVFATGYGRTRKQSALSRNTEIRYILASRFLKDKSLFLFYNIHYKISWIKQRSAKNLPRMKSRGFYTHQMYALT